MSANTDWHKSHHQSLIEDALEVLNSPEFAEMQEQRTSFQSGLINYLEHRIETGGFLRCVLENDLAGAAAHAHPSVTMKQLRGLMQVILGTFPNVSWGSPEKVENWLHPNVLRD